MLTVTGAIYHLVTNPPPSAEVAARLVQRADDTQAAIGQRIEKYHQNLAAVRSQYADILVRVNGNQAPAAVFALIATWLDRAITQGAELLRSARLAALHSAIHVLHM